MCENHLPTTAAGGGRTVIGALAWGKRMIRNVLFCARFPAYPIVSEVFIDDLASDFRLFASCGLEIHPIDSLREF